MSRWRHTCLATPRSRGQPLPAHQPSDRQPATSAPICVCTGTVPPPEVAINGSGLSVIGQRGAPEPLGIEGPAQRLDLRVKAHRVKQLVELVEERSGRSLGQLVLRNEHLDLPGGAGAHRHDHYFSDSYLNFVGVLMERLLPQAVKPDVVLLEESARIGFFDYGPRLWMVGEVEPLNALQDDRQRTQVIGKIIESYPRVTIGTNDIFYRLRKKPINPVAASEYDSPPDTLLGTNRFDSLSLPILYASQDIEVCIHDCRVSVEDELYVTTMRPVRNLDLLDLTEVVDDNSVESDSLDIAVHMLFLAGEHSYGISREIARSANEAGLNGIVYPSYFSVVRTGRMPIETVYGISIRKLEGYQRYAKAQIIPNLALFGRPVSMGSVSVHCINRLVLTRIMYDGVFGPVNF